MNHYIRLLVSSVVSRHQPTRDDAQIENTLHITQTFHDTQQSTMDIKQVSSTNDNRVIDY